MASPSLHGVPRDGSPASTILWDAPTPRRPSRPVRILLTVTDFGGQSMKPRESKPPQVSAMASLDSESEGGLTERLSADEKSARSTCFPATSSNSDTDSSPLHEKRLYQRPPQNQ